MDGKIAVEEHWAIAETLDGGEAVEVAQKPNDMLAEEMEDGAVWFDRTELADSDRLKIGRRNAIKLFKLDMA